MKRKKKTLLCNAVENVHLNHSQYSVAAKEKRNTHSIFWQKIFISIQFLSLMPVVFPYSEHKQSYSD